MYIYIYDDECIVYIHMVNIYILIALWCMRTELRTVLRYLPHGTAFALDERSYVTIYALGEPVASTMTVKVIH